MKKFFYLGAISAIICAIALTNVSQVQAATRSWDGGGGDNNWSTCANWTADTCPIVGDTALFDNTSDKNSTVDSGWVTANGGNDDIAILNMTTGYDGTITLATSFQTTSTFTVTSGVFNASTQTVDVDSNFTLNNGGTFRASSGTMTFAAGFTINSGGTWDISTNSGGTVTFDGTSGTISCNNASFNLVNVTHSSGIKTLGVGGNCNLPLGNNPTIGTGTAATTVAGTLSGTGTLTATTGTFTANSGASFSGFSGYSFAAFTVSGGSIDASSASSFTASGGVTVSSGSLSLPSGADLNSTLIISGGTFNAPAGTITIAATFTISGSPTFNNGSGTITFDAGSAALTCASAVLNHVIINSSGIKTLSGGCNVNNFTVSAGTFGNPASAATLAVRGNYALNANTTFGGANLTVSFTGTGTQSISRSTGTYSSKFDVNNTGTAQLTTALTVTGQTCTVTAGTFSLNGQTFTCATGFSVASGAFLQLQGAETSTSPTLSSGSTVRYSGDGGTDSDTYTLANWSYSNLIINATDGISDTFNFNNNFTPAALTLTAGTVGKSAGASTLTTSGLITINGATWNPGALAITANSGITCSSGTLSAGTATIDINGTLTISGCDMTAPASSMTVSGNFAHSSGTFTANGGTVTLDGTSQSITGTTTFYNLTKAVTSADTLTFPASATQTITNTITLTGTSGNVLTLASSSPPTQWLFDPQGTRTISYVSVSNSNNTNATVIATIGNNITDGGNNTNWDFDTSGPSVTLTPVSPDPTTDTTPTISGTATDASSALTAIEYQIDSTAGSWTTCDADDGAINETSETFTCTSTVLAVGSHTFYVRATDSFSNTSSIQNDAFTITVASNPSDTTAPSSFELHSPSDNAYINAERPTFKWKASTDETGLSQYRLEIDNPSTGDAQPSGDFSISDIPPDRTTDYETNKFRVQYENFGDTDATNNYISIYTKSSNEWSISENDGKLREGIVTWKVKAVDTSGNERLASRTLFVDRTNASVEFIQINATPISTNSFTTNDRTPVIFGKITDRLSGGNSSQEQSETGPRVASGPKQIEIKIERLERAIYIPVTTYVSNIDEVWYTCTNQEIPDNTKQRCDKYVPFEYIQKENLALGKYRITVTGRDKADNLSSSTVLFLNVTTYSQIAQSGNVENNDVGYSYQAPIRDFSRVEVNEETKDLEESIPAAESEPELTIPNSELITDAGVDEQASIWQKTFGGLFRFSYNLMSYVRSIGSYGVQMVAEGFTNSHNLLVNMGEWAHYATISFGEIVLDKEPTQITEVKVTELSSTHAVITWKTNHLATSKVNFGDSLDYGHDVQSNKKVHDHRIEITNLTPGKKYYYEVMSQNRVYVYDAHHEFITPEK